MLSVVMNITGSLEYWIGATRDSSSPPFGFTWVDGTSAGNLNCGSTGCGIWRTIEPSYVFDASFDARAAWFAVVNSHAHALAFTCPCPCMAMLPTRGGAETAVVLRSNGLNDFTIGSGLSGGSICEYEFTCPARYSCNTGSLVLCPLGQYQPGGVDVCSTCPQGQFTATVGSMSCLALCPTTTQLTVTYVAWWRHGRSWRTKGECVVLPWSEPTCVCIFSRVHRTSVELPSSFTPMDVLPLVSAGLLVVTMESASFL